MSESSWILPKSLIPIEGTAHQQKSVLSVRNESSSNKENCAPATNGAKSRIKNQPRSLSKEKKLRELQPAAWPAPPPLKTQESTEKEPEQDSVEKEKELDFLTPQTSFAPAQLDDSLSNRIFQAISNKYPLKQEEAENEKHHQSEVLPRDAIDDSSSSCEGEHESDENENDDWFDIQDISEEESSGESVVGFLQLFEDENDSKAIMGLFNDEEEPIFQEDVLKVLSKTVLSSSRKKKPTAKRPRSKRGQSIDTGNTIAREEKHNNYSQGNTSASAVPSDSPIELDSNEIERESSVEVSEPKAEKSPRAPRPALRRPIGSRREAFVPILKPREAGRGVLNQRSKPLNTSDDRITKDELKDSQPGVEVLRKGVIMRAEGLESHVMGIRRAETGRIMSRAEIRAAASKTMLFQDNPNPKSLHPAAFMNSDDDEDGPPTTIPVAVFPRTIAKREEGTGENSAPSSHGKSAGDGSFLSPGLVSRRLQSSHEENVNSFQFSEHDESSGILNRLGTSFRKATSAVSKRTSSNVPEAGRTDFVIVGTIGEAVIKICLVCRKRLNCNVFVKDTGRKIKVESRENDYKHYLRASILLRPIAASAPACAINVRQSRSDGMRTTFPVLWEFYQGLEKTLKEME